MALDFALSHDQEAIADLFGGFFAKESPAAVARAAEPLGFSADLWRSLVATGASGMGAAVADDGGGASLGDLVVASEALGRHLAPVPLVEHTVAARLLPEADIVAGSAIATIALTPAGTDGAWRLVPAGAVADVVIGVDGDDLVACRSAAPMRAPANHGDQPLADRSSRDGDRQVLGPAERLAVALDEWRILTAAALTGIATAALDLAVAYVLERHQFGRPIGAYQSVQHGLADVPALVDGAWFLTNKAAWAADAGLRDEAGRIDMDEGVVTEASALASMAFLQAADAAAVCTDRSLHYHGGYGFSSEYDIQLYFRRARGWANVAGDPGRERARLADLLWPAEAS